MYVFEDGEEVEIELDGEYLVTTNGFTGQGGDGHEIFKKAFEEGRVKDIGEIDWEQLRDYMVEEKYLDGIVDPEIEGRINDLKGQPLPDDETDTDEIISQLKDRIEKLEEALKKLEAGNKDLADEIADLYKLLAALQAELEAGNTSIEDLEKRIAELEARIAELEQQNSDDSGTSEDSGKEDDNGKDDENGNGKDEAGKGEKPSDTDGKLPQTGTNKSPFL